jgi:hypothetical protein
MQTLTLDTLAGPRPVPAPDGWRFEKTAVIVWAKLLEFTREARGPFKRQRDQFVVEGQIEALANVLASAIGMAPFYWQQEARRIVGREG